MTELILFVIIVVFGVYVQSLTGFGGPLLAMPLSIVLVGVGMARPVITVMAFVSGLLVMIPCRKDINWKKLGIMGAVMLVGVIVGNWMINFQVLLRPLLIFYGATVLIIGLRRLIFPDAYTVPKVFQYLALGAAGIMQGLFTSGGSFLVLYAVEQLKDKDEFRATLSAVWVLLNIYLLASFAVTGVFTHEVLVNTGICIVPSVLAIWLAHITAGKVKQDTFLKITYCILVLSGFVLLVNNIL